MAVLAGLGLVAGCVLALVVGLQPDSLVDTPTRVADPSTPVQVRGLDADLVARFRQAAITAHAEAGIEITITSGWRSAAQQQEILDAKVAEVGVDEAHRLVAPVDASAHVQGLALDVGPYDGALWLRAEGWRFGLCQVYVNEPWHFEPTVDPGTTCPPLVPDVSGLWR